MSPSRVGPAGSMTSLALLALLALLATLPACSDAPNPTDAGDSAAADTSADVGADGDTGTAADTTPPPPFELTSDAFTEGGEIPAEYLCGPGGLPSGPGTFRSPPLRWTAGPPETRSYAITLRIEDVTRPSRWAIFDLAEGTREIAAGVPRTFEPPFPVGSRQALLDGENYGYYGPCPMQSFTFAVHALRTPMLPGVDATTYIRDVVAVIEVMSLGSATQSGTTPTL